MTLREIEETLQSLKKQEIDIKEAYETAMKRLQGTRARALTMKSVIMAGYKLSWIMEATSLLKIKGFEYALSGEAPDAIDAAIGEFINGFNILKEGYIGCKNYAQFTCQRSDHPHGYGPKHGSIVFSIASTKPYSEYSDIEIDACIYTLNLMKQQEFLDLWSEVGGEL